MADNVYGFTDSKSRVQVVDKATYDAKNTEQDNRIITLEAGVDSLEGVDGIQIVEGKIGHINSIEEKTSFVGSASNALRLKIDSQGHITGVDTDPIYPPTSPGTAGQVWTSDGAGPGLWQTIYAPTEAGSTGQVWSMESDGTASWKTRGVARVDDVETITLNTWYYSSYTRIITVFTRQSQNLVIEGGNDGETAEWLYGMEWDNNNGNGCSSLTFVIKGGRYYRIRVNANRDDVLKTSDTYIQSTILELV